MQVSEVLVRNVEIATPDTPLLELARRMRESAIGFVPIVEGERLVGVITDRDIVLRAVSECKDPERASAGDVMSLEVVCCFEDDTAEHARMADHNIRRLPVIDHDHRLVGIVKLPELEGQESRTKKAVKVTLQKEKTDSLGHPHKVPIRTMYITGVKDKGAGGGRPSSVSRRRRGPSGPMSPTASRSRKNQTESH
jgi:CBS-domain-containing membrane protein